jgi:hypothetical protein
MNRSKKIDDLIDLHYIGHEILYITEALLQVKEYLSKRITSLLIDHLSVHFLSLAHDTPEYIEFTEGSGIVFWSLEELVACYIDNALLGDMYEY